MPFSSFFDLGNGFSFYVQSGQQALAQKVHMTLLSFLPNILRQAGHELFFSILVCASILKKIGSV
jgi:hypothetical protein